MMIDPTSLFIGGVIGLLGAALGWFLAREPSRHGLEFTVTADTSKAEKKIKALERRLISLTTKAEDVDQALAGVRDVGTTDES